MKETILKRLVVVSLTGVLCLATYFSLAAAQGSFPTRPITLMIGFSAGGTTDIVLRPLAEGVEKSLGQKIVIMNKPGAGGAVAASLVARAKPDGYTLAGFPDTPITRSPHLENLDYDPFRDLSFIFCVGRWKNVFVTRADSPFKKWSDVIAWAKKNPGQLTYGHAGAGVVPHLVMSKVAKKEGFTYKDVPFRGAAPLLSALLGGHVMLAGTGSMTIHSHVDAKTLRVLLVFENEGLDYAPDAPTFEKVGYDFEAPLVVLICGPKGIPDNVRETLEKGFIAGMKYEAFQKVAKEQELILTEPLTGKALLDYQKKWYGLYEQFIKEAGIHKSQKK
jgi:tripartite-type tricarboxylate transporter receptor subunit TctC